MIISKLKLVLGGFAIAIGCWGNRYFVDHRKVPGFTDLPFNSSDWKANKTSAGISFRHEMVKDLLTKHQFVGLTEQTVCELLGAPTGENSSTGRAYYNLGRKYVDQINGQLIIVYQDNKVTKVVYSDGGRE